MIYRHTVQWSTKKMYMQDAAGSGVEVLMEKVPLTIHGMPKKVPPSHAFGERLAALRVARGLTQTQLAELVGSSQRCISRYETVAEFPPAPVLVEIAKVLRVSADELLGLKAPKRAPEPVTDPEERRLWKKFQQIMSLTEKDRRAVIRLVNSLVAAKQSRAA
jgi:transcriptional regulator with XRE-family HTH domain